MATAIDFGTDNNWVVELKKKDESFNKKIELDAMNSKSTSMNSNLSGFQQMREGLNIAESASREWAEDSKLLSIAFNTSNKFVNQIEELSSVADELNNIGNQWSEKGFWNSYLSSSPSKLLDIAQFDGPMTWTEVPVKSVGINGEQNPFGMFTIYNPMNELRAKMMNPPTPKIKMPLGNTGSTDTGTLNLNFINTETKIDMEEEKFKAYRYVYMDLKSPGYLESMYIRRFEDLTHKVTPYIESSVPGEDIYIEKYLGFYDIKRFQQVFAKMYNVKAANLNAFEAQYKFKGDTSYTPVSFRFQEIDLPEQQKNTYYVAYGPTGLNVVLNDTGRQSNVFTIKVLLSRDLAEFKKYSEIVGFGFFDKDKGYNLNYILSQKQPEKDLTLYLKMKSNAWQARIGTAGYKINSYTRKYGTTEESGKESVPAEKIDALFDLDKKMPTWVFEKFKIRTIQFPTDFDFTARKPAELILTCTAVHVYPIF